MEKKKKTTEHKILLVEAILPNPDNPRVVNEKSESFSELVKSIEKTGVQVPVHVIDHPKKEYKYALLAGDRRLRASQKAKSETIPALIHRGLTPDEAFEITFVENFAREDLTPVEQGRAVSTLLKKFKNDVKAVAGKLGQTERWVKTRSAIDNKLIKQWKDLSVFPGWTGGHLAIIAKCPESLQLELFDYFDDENQAAPTVTQLEKILADNQRLWSKAPWNLDEKMSIGLKNGKSKKIACSDCPNRTGFQPELWDDDTSPEALKKNDKCLNSNCWKQKALVHLKTTFAILKGKHPDLVCVTENYSPRSYLLEAFGTVLNYRQYDHTIKANKNAVSALMVDGDKAGKMFYVALKKAGSTAVKKQTAKGQAKPLKARRVLHNSKRWFMVLKHLTVKIAKSKVSDIQHKDKSLVLLSLAYYFGAHHNSRCANSRMGVFLSSRNRWTDFNKTMKTKATKQTLENLWPDIASVLVSRVSYDGPITQVSASTISEAKEIAKLLGIDIGAMFAEQVKEIPEPKSWSKLNEDGTPKTAKPKKAKAKKAVKKTAKKKRSKKTVKLTAGPKTTMTKAKRKSLKKAAKKKK